jgi:tripeptide aminopeptidase
MDEILKILPFYVDQIKSIKEAIISNIVLIGQTPGPTFEENARADLFLERLTAAMIDECGKDQLKNAVGIIKGKDSNNYLPIFLTAHLDTDYAAEEVDHNYIVRKNSITGPGILDNSLCIGILATLPQIFRHLDLSFSSDIVLAAVTQSIGRGNLRGIRHLLNSWDRPIRSGIILEGQKLGHFNYYSEGIIRGEISCDIPTTEHLFAHKFKPNAILVLNTVINELLSINLPQRPRCRIIIGKLIGGHKHGVIACSASLGFEIQSDSDEMVKKVYEKIEDIVEGIGHEHSVALKLETITVQNAASLKYGHPLVKCTVSIMHSLGLKPVSESSESELSVFLSRNIPAVALGITTGKNAHLENATMRINPMFTGIAQIIGLLLALDQGMCYEK